MKASTCWMLTIDWTAVAAWVQAIGSIGAILGAFYGIKYQLRRQEDARIAIAKEEKQETLGSVIVILEQILALQNKLDELLSPEGFEANQSWQRQASIRSIQIKSHCTVLESIPSTVMPTSGLLAEFASLRAQTQCYLNEIKPLMQDYNWQTLGNQQSREFLARNMLCYTSDLDSKIKTFKILASLYSSRQGS